MRRYRLKRLKRPEGQAICGKGHFVSPTHQARLETRCCCWTDYQRRSRKCPRSYFRRSSLHAGTKSWMSTGSRRYLYTSYHLFLLVPFLLSHLLVFLLNKHYYPYTLFHMYNYHNILIRDMLLYSNFLPSMYKNYLMSLPYYPL